MKAALRRHQTRMLRVLDHIDQHLDEELDLDRLSGIAAYSKFHFHRLFTASFGLSLHRYVQLARLKRASYRLAYREGDSVTEIALDAGYEAPDAFARAFRQRFRQSPSDFRKSPDWQPWMDAFDPLDHARSLLMQQRFTPADVTIRDVAPTPVAIMEHHGDPATLPATIQRFIAWRKSRGLHPGNSQTFNVWFSERRPDNPADYRMHLCAGTDLPIAPDDPDVTSGTIPGGRCAVLRVVGHTHNLEPAALFLYRDWLPASGEEPGDFPLYCQRLRFFPEVPEHETVADVFLPLRPLSPPPPLP